MAKRLIWDWNGTLLDDVSAAVNALNRMLVKRAVKPVTHDFYRRRFGFPVRPFYAEIGVDLDKWDWDGICEDFHSFIAEEPQAVRPDARDALELAASRGMHQCVLSALRQDLLEASLERAGLSGFFDLVYGVGDLDGASKLERGRELASALGGGIRDSVMIGDTLHDAEVAAALGASCVLVSCGHQEKTRLLDTGCPVADSLVEAVRLVPGCR